MRLRTYSVGRQPTCFLKLVAKYDGELKPTIELISEIEYLRSRSSLQAWLKRILRMNFVADSPVMDFIFRWRFERLMQSALLKSFDENSSLSMFSSTMRIAFLRNSPSIELEVILSGSISASSE